jgi:hypothetical protein
MDFLMAINLNPEELQPFLVIFQCVAGKFPMKYLGIPLHFEKLRREDLKHLIDSLLGRMAGWRGKLLSSEAKRILIQTWLVFQFTFYPFFNFPNGLSN